MQTLVQAGKIDQLEQEVYELRGEVTTLRAEVEKLTNLVSSLIATNDPPLVQQRPQPLCQPMCIKRPRQQVHQRLIPQNQAPHQLIPQNQVRKASQWESIPMKYADLLPVLLKKNLVQTLAPPRVPNPLPPWYRPDQNCIFYQGAPGHDTEQCYPLKEKVHKLIENNIWSFEDLDIKVLLQQQYLTSHSVAAVKPIINVVQSSSYQPQFQQYQRQPQQQAPRTQIDPIPMSYADLFPRLLERNLFHTKAPLSVPAIPPVGYRADLSCAFHQGAPGHDIEQCFALQKIVQELIRKNLIPFEEFGFEYAS